MWDLTEYMETKFVLYFTGNNRDSDIPKELANLKNLSNLDLYANKLTGVLSKTSSLDESSRPQVFFRATSRPQVFFFRATSRPQVALQAQLTQIHVCCRLVNSCFADLKTMSRFLKSINTLNSFCFKILR